MFIYIDPTTGIAILSVGGWIWVVLLFIGGSFAFFAKKILNFLKKYKYYCLFLFFLLSLGIVMFFCSPKKTNSITKKIIILGLDGLSPEILQSLLDQNKLPHFSKLAEQGTYKKLTTSNPSQSPVAWAAFATGKNPGKNGVYDFITRDPHTYKLSLTLTKFQNGKPISPIQEKCFWDYTIDKNVHTIILGCPDTFPPTQVHGKMLSGMGVPDIIGTQGTFSFYTTDKTEKNKQVGGQIFYTDKKPTMVFPLHGPKITTFQGNTESVVIHFSVKIQTHNTVQLTFPDSTIQLQQNVWSDYHAVTFPLGWWNKSCGIVRFLLLEIEPHLKIYAEPIQMDPRQPYFPISYPKTYSKEIAETLGLFHTQGMPMDTWAVNENKLSEHHFLEQVQKIHDDRRKLMNHELKTFSNGVFFCYYEAPDIIQHMFWRYRDKESLLYTPNADNIIEQWYIKMDEIIADVLPILSPEDVLIVLSDHGFTHFRRAVHINTWLREQGYLQLKNPYATEGKELFQDIDWSRTKAYACGFGSIYLNKQNREKQGIVLPEEEEEILQELIQLLQQWKDSQNNQSIFNNIYKGKEIFQGKYQHVAPDLYVGFQHGYRASWQTALGACPPHNIEDNTKKWSGDHLCDSILVPGILLINQKIVHEQPTIYDIVPTLLHLLQYTPKEIQQQNFDGISLFEKKSRGNHEN
ncbi:MAG TPA: alkaline phosphatase family protein [Planctomycetota bacterium]|nr:alkaline phosphatase family protein [Planctomycetota bacterium]HRU51211.1 alkaline phosphatase family protein [Planctomycetota bacterium]